MIDSTLSSFAVKSRVILRRNLTHTHINIAQGCIRSPNLLRDTQPCLPHRHHPFSAFVSAPGKRDSRTVSKRGIRDLSAMAARPPKGNICQVSREGHICLHPAEECSKGILRAAGMVIQLWGIIRKHHLEITDFIGKHGLTTPDPSVFPLIAKALFSPVCP